MSGTVTFKALSEHFKTIAGTLSTPAGYLFGDEEEIDTPSRDYPLVVMSSREDIKIPPFSTTGEEEPASSLGGTELMTGSAHETHNVRLSVYSLYSLSEHETTPLADKFDAVQALLMEFIYKSFSTAYATDYVLMDGTNNIGIYRKRHDNGNSLVSVEARFAVKVYSGAGGYTGFTADFTKEYYTIDFVPGGLNYAYIFCRSFSTVSFDLVTTVSGGSEFTSVSFQKDNLPVTLPFSGSRGNFVKVSLNGWTGNTVQIRVTGSKQPYSESGRGVKFGGDGRYIFVWNNASLTISKIDTSAGDTVTTLSAFGFTPDAQSGLVFNPDDGLIYFFASSTKIVAIDPMSLTITRTVTIPAQGSGAWGGCYDPFRKLILFHRSYSGFLFNPTTDTINGYLTLSSRGGVGYLAPIDSYVSFDFDSFPGIYEGSSLNESLWTTNTTSQFAGCFYVPATNRIYVSCSANVKVVNLTAGLPVVAAIGTVGNARAGCAYVLATGKGYFPSYNGGSIAVIDTVTNLLSTTFNVTLAGGETGIADCLYSEFTGYIYLLPFGSSVNRIMVLDPATNTVVKSIAVGTSGAASFNWQSALVKNRLIYHG